MNRIELLDKFLYFIENETHLNKEISLFTEDVYLLKVFNTLPAENHLIQELKSKIRELKLEKIIN